MTVGRPTTQTSRFAQWHRMSIEAAEYLQNQDVSLVDIFLVGSSVASNGIMPNSDMDSVVLIENDFSRHSLFLLRRKLAAHLFELDASGLYHFKLVDEKELDLLSCYDGFRLLEFQLANRSLLDTSRLLSFTPSLTLESFCNSILIQLVYESLSKYAHSSGPIICSDNRSVHKRIERNIKLSIIRNNALIESADHALKICRCKSEILDLMLKFRHLDKPKREPFKWLMRRYFKAFPHEYINKYDNYFSIIASKFDHPISK